MRLTWKSVPQLARKHPLALCALVLFVGMPSVLGWMHEGRILLDCSIPLIRPFKHECTEWRESVAHVRRELTTWEDSTDDGHQQPKTSLEKREKPVKSPDVRGAISRSG